ncbi:MAG TPA: transporter substrate-binding domain-containing protein [Rhodocyclaceae bacterium]|nr:transporter substrate-binding domain-containing protein [Rhodocyclaceae bacterium]
MRRLLLTTIMLLACVQAASAEPIVLVTANYPPFSYEEDGQQKGLAIELIKVAFQRMRQEVRIEFVPFARAVEMVKNGEADGVFPFAVSDERKMFATFSSEKLLTDPGSLFVRADSTLTFDGDYAKLAPYTIGMQRGTNHGPAFMQALTTYGIKTDLAENQEKNVLKLVSGRFDIAVGPRLVVLHAARQAGKQSEIKLLYSGISEGHAYLAVSKRRNREALIAEFDQAISKMRRDGSYDKILRAY